MIVTEMQDYIIAALKAVATMDDVVVFQPGFLPDGIMITQDKHPLCEVAVVRKLNEGELTGGCYQDNYEGVIAITTIETEAANADWQAITDRVAADFTSYLTVRALATNAINELRKCEHRDMGELTDDNKVVVQFSVAPDATYGAGQNERTTNWENMAIIQFTAETQEVYA